MSAGGIAIDFSYASLSSRQYGTERELTQSTLAVGPWLRFGHARALDGRVEMSGAVDLQFGRLSSTADTSGDPAQRQEASATGVSFAWDRASATG